MNLLIIDPQDDFHTKYNGHPREEGYGALAVNGSVEDSTRIIEFLPKFDNVYVSLDTHTEKHIGHHGFWKRIDNGNIEEIQGRSLLIEDGNKIIATDGESKIEIEAKDENLKEYAKNYVNGVNEKEKIEGLGKLPMCWNTHCILGEKGHDIYGPLKEALKKYTVEYFVKGQNELAEMYSIFRSEVQPKDIDGLPEKYKSGLRYNGQPDDNLTDSGKVDIDNIMDVDSTPYLITDYNENKESLLNKLIDANKDVYICGEALSHCVNYSLRDFAEYAASKKFNNKIKLVMNASSCVVLPFEGTQKLFYGNIVKLIDDIQKKKENGLGLVDIVFWNGTDFISSDSIVGFIKNFYEEESDYSEELYKKFKKDIQERLLEDNPNYMKHTKSSEAKRILKGGKRRTRKRSKRKRTQRKQKRSQRKRTRRSRR